MKRPTAGPTTEPERSSVYDRWSRLEFPPFCLHLFFLQGTLSAVELYLGPEPPEPAGLPLGPCPPRIAREFRGYFEGRPTAFSFATRFQPPYTPFQLEVWETLQEVPWGQVRSYGWLAERVGHPGAARAVGGALGRNPLPIVYPCHRIVESTGALGGYSSGLDLKIHLLRLEGVTVEKGRVSTV